MGFWAGECRLFPNNEKASLALILNSAPIAENPTPQSHLEPKWLRAELLASMPFVWASRQRVSQFVNDVLVFVSLKKKKGGTMAISKFERSLPVTSKNLCVANTH